MSENQDFVINPNETPLIPYDKIEKAYTELAQLLETIELIVFNAHAIYKPHKDRELIVNSETFEMVFELTYDFVENKVPSNIRQLIDEYSDFHAFVRKVLEIYAENVKRFSQFLAQPNYTPIAGANNFATTHKLFDGIDVASIIYEYQMLYTTVQYAYMTVIEEVIRSSIPTFQFIRNKYNAFVGLLVDVLPLLIHAKRVIEENIRSTGSYTTAQEILKLLYGIHLELLKGWLVKTTTKTNLFFVDYSVNDTQKVLQAFNDFLQGLRTDYASNAVLFSHKDTKQILSSDPLWKTKTDTLKDGIYRTPYILADIKSVDELTNQIIDYLEAYVLIFYVIHEMQDINAAAKTLSQLLEKLRKAFADKGVYYESVITAIFSYTNEESLSVWYKYMQTPVRVTLFGESYDLTVVELILLALITLNNLLTDSMFLANKQINTSDINIESLFMTVIANAEYIDTRTNIFRELRNKEIKQMLESAQQYVRKVTNSLLYIAEAINPDFRKNLTVFFDTFENASLDARIRETIKLFTTTLLLAMPLIDPNFVTLPLTSTLYSYIGANILPLITIVSDLLLRVFELPYRLIKTRLMEFARTIEDFTNYLTFEDRVQVIQTNVGIGFSSLFGRFCLYYCLTDINEQRVQIEATVDVSLLRDYVLQQTDSMTLHLDYMSVLAKPFCLYHINQLKDFQCLRYRTKDEFYKIALPATIADALDFTNELRLRFARP